MSNFVETDPKAFTVLKVGGTIPIQPCQEDGKDGFRYGPTGKCYTHDGSEEGKKAARAKAAKQGRAIEASKHANSAYHTVGIWPGDEPDNDIRNPVEPGVWKVFRVGDDPTYYFRYEFDPDIFTEAQAKAWLDKNGIKYHEWAFSAAKQQNAGELSYEYLKAVYDRVMAHPAIWAQIKDEIHVAARASAGGLLKAKYAKQENSASIAGDYIETDEYIDAPAVLAREGVFTGANGLPTLKRYENLKASLPRFLGVAVTPKHLNSSLRPDDRWLGHVVDVTSRDDKRDIFGRIRFYKSKLTADELSKIRSKQYPDGSIGYYTPLKIENGEFKGKKYVAEELGPYVLEEYATFFDGTRGACSRDDGCGPFQNSAVVESDDVLRLIDGEVKKCPRKQKNQSGDLDNMTPEEFKKLLNEALAPTAEAITGITARVDALEKQMNEAPDLAGNPTFKALVETVKQIYAAMPDIQAFKAEQDAAKDLRARTSFGKLLNAAALEDGKVPDKIWNEAKADPLAYLEAHPEMRLGTISETKFRGKILNSDGSEFDLAAEQAKLFGY
ncbi:MAG: hypothetical protein A4E48_00230 [Methanosaeta sp. PtaU1.Bin060]|nr:MAG: hypothetical protein A4E48_00230 [Methanosaeta sp. PtaU1.Bin060]